MIMAHYLEKYLNFDGGSRLQSDSRVCSVMSDSLRPHGLQPTKLLYPWDSPGKNTGEGWPFPSSEDLPNTRIKFVRMPSVLCLMNEFETNKEHSSRRVQKAIRMRAWNPGDRTSLKTYVQKLSTSRRKVDSIAQKECDGCQSRKDGQNPRKQDVEDQQSKRTWKGD